MVLVDFSDPAAVGAWQAVNDVVMGGVSTGRIVAVGGGAAFTGCVSLEHGGGFASVRSGPRSWPTAGATALRLTTRGDGRRYKLTLRTEDRFDGIQYQAGFVPAAEWQALVVPLSVFAASFRGRPHPAAAPLDAAQVRTLGLMIADGQSGPFRLEIARLETL
jgi:NADH dehydrogenase [ubiquinone] 1 alpha subcomplex assembly factor 1